MKSVYRVNASTFEVVVIQDFMPVFYVEYCRYLVGELGVLFALGQRDHLVISKTLAQVQVGIIQRLIH